MRQKVATTLKMTLCFLGLATIVFAPFSESAYAQDVQFKYEAKPDETKQNSVIKNFAEMRIPSEAGVKSNTTCTKVGNATESCAAVGGTLAGWPTDGVLTQGPRGGTSHNNIYLGSKAESVDIAWFSPTGKAVPNVYPTFNAAVKTVFYCKSNNSCHVNYGNFVDLTDGSDKFKIRYGHLEEIYVQKGDTVTRKDKLGLMGTTGYSTGIHLHWEFDKIPLKVPNIPHNIEPENCNSSAVCKAGGTNMVSYDPNLETGAPPDEPTTESYWFILNRSAKREYLFYGVPGDQSKSTLKKTFAVNPGIANRYPTPDPKKAGQQYWTVESKREADNQATLGPYFLKLNIPYQNVNNGPTPYLECSTSGNAQCNWDTPGDFGLHGIGNNSSGLTDQGSSGCVRHSNEDIRELYNLIEPGSNIRYYVDDTFSLAI